MSFASMHSGAAGAPEEPQICVPSSWVILKASSLSNFWSMVNCSCAASTLLPGCARPDEKSR